MEKCLICENTIFKKHFCNSHYNEIKKVINTVIQEKKKEYEYTTHYHNLRFSIMKMSNKKFIIDNLINLIAISEAYFIKFNKLNLVNKVYLFTKETIFRIEENVAKIDKEKETILLNRNSEIDFRQKWKKDFLCDDGHYVRSLSEMVIDNWLYKNNIIHSYEKQCFLQDNDFLVCDFYIPSIDVYIEYWGKYQHNYISRKKAKQELYKENNIKLINVEYDNLKNIDNFMISQIKYYQEKK